jgi:UDP-N-acetylglucosamine/UDP-N-acetylgalactosamine diphosphorylase
MPVSLRYCHKIHSKMTMAIDESELRRRFDAAGQSHVFQHFDTLSDERKSAFLEQLSGIQVDKLATFLACAQSEDSQQGSIEPVVGTVARTISDINESGLLGTARSTGLAAIRQGHVAALVLAGGQGTRLGYSGPKGMYDIGLPSGLSLFALMAARIQRLSRIAAAKDDANAGMLIPFYVMTSPLNHDETVSYFESNSYFDLGESNVFFFRQGMLPCLTMQGKIILEAADAVAMAPDGNGGIYPSMVASGALDDMSRRGVQYLHVYSIDNALVKPADPVFIGYCIEQEADCGNKVVWKAHAHEPVGVVASRSGKPCIVEYSEITKEMAEQTDAAGMLVYGAANICNHFYTLDFVRNVILPNMGNLYHVAHKKIPYYDETTATTATPDSNNGIKLETFIFDVFPFSERMAVLDVQREDEFAPVKNKPGSPSDSPDTAREMISAQAIKWIVAAGASLKGAVSSVCEILPSTSYAGEGLEGVARGKEISCPFCL